MVLVHIFTACGFRLAGLLNVFFLGLPDARSILKIRSAEYLEVFHENSNDDVDENKLRHQDEDDEEDWGDNGTDAAVVNTVARVIAVVS